MVRTNMLICFYASQLNRLAKTSPAAICPELAEEAAETRKSLNKNESLAERTGLEPATPGVTGRYSNQLNYRSGWGRGLYRGFSGVATRQRKPGWWVLRESNPRHSPCKGDALPTELSTRALTLRSRRGL